MADTTITTASSKNTITGTLRLAARTAFDTLTLRRAGPAAMYFGYTTIDYFDDSQYEGMNENFAEYARDSIVRNSINMTGNYATRKGFSTIIRPITGQEEDYTEVKKKVDNINRKVNLDQILYTAVIKKKIYGKAGYEIVRDDNDEIFRLLPLISDSLAPRILPNFELEGFDYPNLDTDIYPGGFYPPEAVLYFTENELEADWEGRSAIEPIRPILKVKRALIDDLAKASKRLWAPIGFFEMDLPTGMKPAEKKREMQNFANQIKPGHSVVHDKKIRQMSIVDMKPNIAFLIRAIQQADEEVMGNFGIPKALMARERTVARATLEFSIKALYEGQIEPIQAYMKREIERQFYDIIVKEMKKENVVRITHEWKPITLIDFISMAKPVTDLVGAEVITKTEGREFLNVPETMEIEESEDPPTKI